jgi:hypothetical protein
MTSVEQLYEEAMRLAPEERKALAAWILEATDDDTEFDSYWAPILQERLAGMYCGREAVSGSAALQAARQHLDELRSHG